MIPRTRTSLQVYKGSKSLESQKKDPHLNQLTGLLWCARVSMVYAVAKITSFDTETPNATLQQSLRPSNR